MTGHRLLAPYRTQFHISYLPHPSTYQKACINTPLHLIHRNIIIAAEPLQSLRIYKVKKTTKWSEWCLETKYIHALVGYIHSKCLDEQARDDSVIAAWEHVPELYEWKKSLNAPLVHCVIIIQSTQLPERMLYGQTFRKYLKSSNLCYEVLNGLTAYLICKMWGGKGGGVPLKT